MPVSTTLIRIPGDTPPADEKVHEVMAFAAAPSYIVLEDTGGPEGIVLRVVPEVEGFPLTVQDEADYWKQQTEEARARAVRSGG